VEFHRCGCYKNEGAAVTKTVKMAKTVT